jgi:hypothetical protein
MNKLLDMLGTFGQILQSQLFPRLREELGEMGGSHEQLVNALALLKMDGFVAVRHGRGRPAHDRAKVARAFLAKAIFRIPHTRALLDRLAHDTILRRLCGWEKAKEIPDETVFSRAFAELAHSEFAQRVHASAIQRTQSERLVGHILRDATAIKVREKPGPKPKPAAAAGRRLHRKAGGKKSPEQMTRLERQCSGTMTPEQMFAELPLICDIGCKLDSRGVKVRWLGYKLHMDVADGQIPISCVLTSASVNDTQAAVPLMLTTAQRVTSLYDIMDTGYDSIAIRDKSRALGHVPIIPFQKRGSQQVELAPHEKVRLRERSAVERVFSRLKDEFGATSVRVRGAVKVMAHLMFGILALAADQILRLGCREPAETSPAPT